MPLSNQVHVPSPSTMGKGKKCDYEDKCADCKKGGECEECKFCAEYSKEYGFCPTGPGGGQDNSCGKEGGGGSARAGTGKLSVGSKVTSKEGPTGEIIDSNGEDMVKVKWSGPAKDGTRLPPWTTIKLLKGYSNELKTRSIYNVEIFSVGKWNNDKFAVDDLYDLVESFAETKDLLKPYLKIGHGEDQKLLAAEELPAAGYVENLRVVGNKLVADFRDVPDKIYQLIQTRAYARVSCEIFFDPEIEGKKYRKALKAVAILGGQTPAVSNLKDILALYGMTESKEIYASSGEARVYDQNAECRKYEIDATTLQQEDGMEKQLKELQDKLAAKEAELVDANAKLAKFSQADAEKLTAELTETKTKLDAVTKEKGELLAKFETVSKSYASISEKMATIEKEKRTNEINAQIDKLITSKKLAPASKEAMFTILSTLSEGEVKKFKLGEAETDPVSAVLKMFESNGVVDINTEEGTKTGEKKTFGDVSDKAKKYAEEHKVSFKEALLAVSPENEKSEKESE